VKSSQGDFHLPALFDHTRVGELHLGDPAQGEAKQKTTAEAGAGK
jgi:hypothetical protein